jgi:hypothetical protein
MRPIKLAVRYLLLALCGLMAASMAMIPMAMIATATIVIVCINVIGWCLEVLLAWSYDKKPPPLRLLDGLK